MAKIVGKMLGMVGYGSGGLGTNNWASDMESNLRKIDAILQAGAIAIQNAPPGSPVDGQVYVVGTAPTGAWVSNANAIARWNAAGSAWEFFAPAVGWWIAVGANDYRFSGTAWVAGWTPSHAATHEFGGADPLTGANIAGLRVTDSPEFNRMTLGSELRLKRGGVQEWGLVAGSGGLELASRNADWSAIDWPIMIGHDAGGVIRLGGTTNRPVNLTYSLQMGGVETISSTRVGTLTQLKVSKALGASRVDLLNDIETWGASSWLDSGANLRISYLQGDTTWTDRFTLSRNGNLNILSGSGQIAGVDFVTSGREGRFTGMRLSNLSSGQIPVSSDGNGQITASGLTDDGTFFGVSRVLRMWNSMARSGNTWTDLQWTQDVNERVSILSSNSSGPYAYHSWVFVPPDAEAAGRVLGGTIWGQKVSGKSGTAPGLKAGMYAKAVGSGGSTGGFGGQIVLNYRPDNGTSQTDALKIGAFGGGVADAVQADILLRANADFLTTYAKIQKDSNPSVGLDVVGPGGTGKLRMVNAGAGSELGLPAGTLEILCANGVGIGVPGGSSIMVSALGVAVANIWTSGSTKSQFLERTGSGATPGNETLIVYTGSSNATESLPAATGSKRIIEFSHCGTGDWTLDANGTDILMDGGSSGVGSVTILPTNATRSRRYIDYQAGKWARL